MHILVPFQISKCFPKHEIGDDVNGEILRLPRHIKWLQHRADGDVFSLDQINQASYLPVDTLFQIGGFFAIVLPSRSCS